MPQEIERKFLVRSNAWRAVATASFAIQQGYLSLDPARTVRIRLRDDVAFLTIKGKAKGITRPEYEYEIPAAEGRELLLLCGEYQLRKTRHLVPFGGKTWEVDVFEGSNHGLVLAEVELSIPHEKIELPSWVGREVSTDPRFFNASLVGRAYNNLL